MCGPAHSDPAGALHAAQPPANSISSTDGMHDDVVLLLLLQLPIKWLHEAG